MKENVLISVVIPIYNKEKYLDKTLESLSSQNYEFCEFILVDDCSTDSSNSICKQWVKKDKRFRLILNKINLGVSDSRNIGLRNAVGTYVCFIDADDIIDKNYFTYLIEEGVGADIIMCGATMVDEVGNTVKHLNNNFSSNGWYSGFDFWKNFQWMLSSAPWNKLFRRELLSQKDCYFKNIKGPEDLLFNFEVIKRDEIIYYDCATLYYYRSAGQSLSKSFGLVEEINDIKVLLMINEYLLDNNVSIFSNLIRIALIKYYRLKKCAKVKTTDDCFFEIKNCFRSLKDQLKRTKLSLKDKVDILLIKTKKYNS